MSGVDGSPAASAEGKVPTAPKSIRIDRLDGVPIYVIMDNPSAHKGPGPAVRRWAKKRKVELCFHPRARVEMRPDEERRRMYGANGTHPGPEQPPGRARQESRTETVRKGG
ncbi:hypothetical protein ACW4TU_07525 [Streptomyces sp. QTS52]